MASEKNVPSAGQSSNCQNHKDILIEEWAKLIVTTFFEKYQDADGTIHYPDNDDVCFDNEGMSDFLNPFSSGSSRDGPVYSDP